MEHLPYRVKAILEDNCTTRSTKLPCCSHCGREEQKDDAYKMASTTSRGQFFPCSGCKTAFYCSLRCEKEHARIHNNQDCISLGRLQQTVNNLQEHRIDDILVHWFGQEAEPVPHMDLGHELMRMGQCEMKGTMARNNYFQKAIRAYLDGIIDGTPLTPRDEVTKAQDRVLLLLICLGGDAQILLDFFDFLSKIDPSTSSNGDGEASNPRVSSLESREQRQHPLLCLHGFFEVDTDTDDCNTSALYLLASARSLVQHTRMKATFDAFKGITTTNSSSYPYQPDTVIATIVSFLVSQHDYDYGEALAGEVRQIVHHIYTNKDGGATLLRQLAANNSDGDDGDATAAALEQPDDLFWVLYRDYFSSIMLKPSPESKVLSLSDFFPLESEDVKAKDKCD